MYIGDKSDQTEEKPVRGRRLLSKRKEKNGPDTDELRLHSYKHKSLCVIIIFFAGTFFLLFHYAHLYYLSVPIYRIYIIYNIYIYPLCSYVTRTYSTSTIIQPITYSSLDYRDVLLLIKVGTTTHTMRYIQFNVYIVCLHNIIFYIFMY